MEFLDKFDKWINNSLIQGLNCLLQNAYQPRVWEDFLLAILTNLEHLVLLKSWIIQQTKIRSHFKNVGLYLMANNVGHILHVNWPKTTYLLLLRNVYFCPAAALFFYFSGLYVIYQYRYDFIVWILIIRLLYCKLPGNCLPFNHLLQISVRHIVYHPVLFHRNHCT